MYLSITVDSSDYVEFPFVDDDVGNVFVCNGMIISNDGDDSVDFAFRENDLGVVLAGTIGSGESLTFDKRYEDRVFFKLSSGDGPYASVAIRFWAW